MLAFCQLSGGSSFQEDRATSAQIDQCSLSCVGYPCGEIVIVVNSTIVYVQADNDFIVRMHVRIKNRAFIVDRKIGDTIISVVSSVIIFCSRIVDLIHIGCWM